MRAKRQIALSISKAFSQGVPALIAHAAIGKIVGLRDGAI